MPALRALGIEEGSWRTFYRLAAAQAAADPTALGSAILLARDDEGWLALLAVLRVAEVPLDAGLAAESVRSESAEIRSATYWSVAQGADPARPADAALAAALGATPEARGQAPDDPIAALAFELMRRAQGAAARPLGGTIKALDPARKYDVLSRLDDGDLFRVLDKAERKAMSTGFYGKADALDDRRPRQRASGPRDPSMYSRVQTIGGYPPGYVTDLVRATGCDFAGLGVLMGGEVTYGADGRPREVGLLQRGESTLRLEAANLLLTSTLAPLGVPTRPDGKSLLLVPDRPEFIQCLDEPRPADTRGRRTEPETGGQIKEPRKVRDIRPHYAKSAKDRGLEGLVLLEATIAPSGCVGAVTLLKGVDTSLDLEAIRAASGWGYTPTLLNGTPVPVLMTISINFRLSR